MIYPVDFLAILLPKTHPIYTQHTELNNNWIKAGKIWVKPNKFTIANIPNGILIFFKRNCYGFTNDGYVDIT